MKVLINKILKASLLIALYSVRSERAFREELDYHLIYRWFMNISLIEPNFAPCLLYTSRCV